MDSDHTVIIEDGTSVEKAIGVALELGISTVLFNCAPPEVITLAIEETARVLDKLGARDRVAFGGYGNIWEEADLTNWTLDKNESTHGASDQKSGGFVIRKEMLSEPTHYTAEVAKWRQAGASIVGGCCGIGPEHIDHLAKHFAKEDTCLL